MLYQLTHLIIPLRVSSEDEELGLDLSQHGESLNGDFEAAPTEREPRKVVNL
jgi:ammonia channel protein AmtB